ncbi:tetratricopeptide repeat protein [Winogradskyella sp. A3E31]|uniref:tetratricopeptide repeat protein n=1 Tax=Winogradskyella sp. A3E31 TaxID=3349637 RepID=UPI00398BA45A
MKLNDYLKELQRRHVVKAGLAYLVFSWLLVQVLSILIPAFELSTSLLKTAIIILAIIFPIWLVFSWVYNFTPDGLKKTEDIEYDAKSHAKKNSFLNRFIIGTLLVAIALLIVNQVRMKNEMTEIISVMNKTDYESSIAVMAFADMSPNKDHEYFSDGISEELLNFLAKIPELKVISRTSSFSYKDKDTKAVEIGKELSVSHILEGSIRKSGNMIRITAQLINTKDGSHEWSETYDRNLDSIFKIQDEIAAQVTNQLQISLLGKRSIVNSNNAESYNLYLQAKHLTRQNTKKGYIEAEEKIKQAIALDSTYAPSWQLLAGIYDTGFYNFSIREGDEAIPLGIKAAQKAIELDPISGEAYASLASLYDLAWEFEKSAKNMNKALELNPNNAVIVGTAALKNFGNIEKAIELQKKAIQLDPLVYGNYFNLGFAYFRLNRLEEAEEAFKTFAIYYPNWQIYHYMMARIRLAQNNIEGAREEIEQEKHDFFGIYGRNFIEFAAGNSEESDKLFAEFLNKFSSTDPSNVADLYAFRGNYEKAFDWLKIAVEKKDPVLTEALTYPSFKPMHSDSRWKQIINSMNLPANHGYSM